ncbi:MAG: TRAP transporter substrate-binding protein DctP [Deltaproteobacteria bacterium]|nr:TRAP transporter substrate-binding protein DctP [Deltaproteobacteria bacterium]
MKKKSWSGILGIVIAAIAFLAPLSASAETEIKAISFLPKDHKLCVMIPVWLERVNAALKGTAKITWVGGPEVMSGLNQPEALRKGIFQLAFLPAAFYNSLLPEGDAIKLSRLDFKHEREKGGLYDYLVERHKKINMVPLGTWLYDPFYLYVSKPVAKLDDLKGRRMRTTANYDRMMKKLGMAPVTIEPGETYTALQRGMVEGFGWPTIGARDMGWIESTKYVIDIPFYARQNVFFLMNLEAWNKLPKDAQDKIMDITVKFEPEMKVHFEKAIEAEKRELEKLGVKRLKFSPEDTRKYIEAADSAVWEDLEKKVPDQVKTLRKLTGHDK